jgi:glyoxylase-like metal-dependent hydrolase (beta-lactamase superfamily II)
MLSITAQSLYERQDDPLILDVRNANEFAHWKVEGRIPHDTLNVPYFEFIELEEESVRKVKAWLAGRTRDLVVVCAKGDSSEFVAEILRGRDIPAVNMEGGMVAWGRETVVQLVRSVGALRTWQILRFGRGCLSYVVAVGEDAIVVDPHHAIEDYREFLRAQQLRLRGVFETHLHADHVSGAPALARAEQVPYHANRADFAGAAFPFEPIEDGARLRIGRLDLLPILTLYTPGHTPGSTSLLVNEALLMAGDTVFVQGLGRPDLGGKTAEWARELYRTLHGRLAGLADDVTVLSAHSSGPHEVGPDGVVSGRLGDALRKTAAMQLEEAAFVRQAEASAGAAPPQYLKMRAINLGQAGATEDELVELELGKNECAMSRH